MNSISHPTLEQAPCNRQSDHRGAGIGVEQDLRKAGYRHLYAARKDGTSNDSKIDHFAKALLYMYDGVVKYPVSAPFLDDVLYALATFRASSP